MKKIFKVAARSSPLAMKQAQMAAEYLSAAVGDSGFEILPFKTLGDKRLEWSLEQKGGKGLFTKELEDALLSGAADFAVHSAKDMPTTCPDGLELAAFLPRDDCRDVFIRRIGAEIGTIATASPRRRAQLKNVFPGAQWAQIRGNVGTRLQKISEGLADATMLSAAGLDRLGIKEFEGLSFERLDISKFVPAVGQGAIAIECRSADAPFFACFSDAPTALAVELERLFLSSLGGGCQSAFGANFDGKIFRLFHEKIGRAQLDFSGLEPEKMRENVRAIAAKIAEIRG
ncbi:MAG: hydroxymethylbilane synthase [Opitutales bacterium]|nr:hydroxymethylbilane synthase [Opitutales bacterium]